MKKSTLALSIAAAIGGFGFAGQALAANATTMVVNPDGAGHQLVFPYFTAQGDNATLLSITNTDTTNGKLVKVRFRGAGNSDDLFDFTLALSPGDMWTASVTKDTTGVAKLTTTDKSCTLPTITTALFGTQRIDSTLTAADKNAQTLEGYVEVINMANIAPLSSTAAAQATIAATALFTAIKHKDGVAPCTSTVLQDKLGGSLSSSDLLTLPTATAGNSAGGLSVPTSGLTGDWIILNQAKTAAWSGSATALKAVTSTGVEGDVNAVFSVQKDVAVAVADAAALTADPLLALGVTAAKAYDFPDMSTPYVPGTTAAQQADLTTAALAVKTIANQYVTSPSIAAVTDFLFAQPTRRYHVAVNYTALAAVSASATTNAVAADNLSTKGTKAVAIYRDTTATSTTSTTSSYYKSAMMGFQGTGRNLCLKDVIFVPGKNAMFDREETTPKTTDTTSAFVISPQTPGAAPDSVFVCGEAAVLSINNGTNTTPSALGAVIARNDISSSDMAKYVDGWMTINTAASATIGNGGNGLPILGSSFIRASNGNVNYGFSYGHKVTH